MINLSDEAIINYSENYIRYMSPKISKKILHYTSRDINPFTGEEITSLFTNRQSSSKEFIEHLLAKDIAFLCKNYEEFKNYFLTSKLIFLSDIDSKNKWASKKNLDNLELKKIRKELVEKYQNQWLYNILSEHKDFYKNKTKYLQFISEIKKKLKLLHSLIDKSINYSMISSQKRHEILYSFKVEVCPYCNRNFISNYEKEGKSKTTSDLDHFYPKKDFKLLSLSLYNFVPSCQICNSRFKLAKGIEIINPYNQKIDYKKMRFCTTLNKDSTLDIFFNQSTNFEIKLICEDEIYNDHALLFELEKLYNCHKIFVSEILYKKEAYNNAYKDSFNELFKNMNLSEIDKNRLLYGTELDENLFYKRPLSKLVYDIVQEN
ncbi:hypothetical protein [Exiguobacterium sp. SH0S2]|uniref:hypothetical protein n=1 Tax=Exiguobacterium sp. SH0S2 TaxID=2510950 RepID=UPI001039E1C0|nr:hypothetical protein [Exiguobacterium sp. SH0S2]TCI62859.1 hypothetical protein EVJ21_04905 [Exiguobacterium sp. SH0S2]